MLAHRLISPALRFKKYHIPPGRVKLVAARCQKVKIETEIPPMFLPILFIVFAFSFFADDAKPSLSGVLTLNAAICFGEEDRRREAVTSNFYLLDESLVISLRAAKFEPVDETSNEPLNTDEAFLSATANALLPSGSASADDFGIIGLLLADVISKHRKAEIKTDSNGIGRMRNIKPGKYYLFGASKSGDETFVWHFPVTINPGAQQIELDQYNAQVF